MLHNGQLSPSRQHMIRANRSIYASAIPPWGIARGACLDRTSVRVTSVYVAIFVVVDAVRASSKFRGHQRRVVFRPVPVWTAPVYAGFAAASPRTDDELAHRDERNSEDNSEYSTGGISRQNEVTMVSCSPGMLTDLTGTWSILRLESYRTLISSPRQAVNEHLCRLFPSFVVEISRKALLNPGIITNLYRHHTYTIW